MREQESMTLHFFLRTLGALLNTGSRTRLISQGEERRVWLGSKSWQLPGWRCSVFQRSQNAALVAFALTAIHLSAHADLWAYVDDRGITHFAIEQVDDRYELFFKSSDTFNLLQLTSEETAGSLGIKATGNAGEPAFRMPPRFAGLESSRNYKSVQRHIRAAAQAHDVDYSLIKAVIAAESGFDHTAVSPKGAVGLMQLMPTTAEQYGVVADKANRKDSRGKQLPAQTIKQKLTDPKTNIQAGARYLAYLIKLFKGELPLALAAYNAGEGAVQRAGNKIPNYKETQGYVKTVLGLYEVFKPAASLPAATAYPSVPGSVAIGERGGRMRVELGRLPNAGAPVDALMPVAYGAPLLADSAQ